MTLIMFCLNEGKYFCAQSGFCVPKTSHMNETIQQGATIAELVRSDYRRADLFKKHEINYCCSGNVSIEEACQLRNLDPEKIKLEMEEATRTITLPGSLRFDQWRASFLADYISNVHHAYENESLPTFHPTLTSFAHHHKKHHPELMQILDVTDTLISLLLKQNKPEEDILFPYIKQLETLYLKKEEYGRVFVRTMR